MDDGRHHEVPVAGTDSSRPPGGESGERIAASERTAVVKGLFKSEVIEPDQYRILIVDDNDANRELMVDILDMVGKYVIEQAEDGASAWAQLNREKFDLVITDVNMPGMNGLELLKRIRKNFGDMPVIVETAFEKNVGSQTLALGADDCIYLPFDIDEFKFRVGRTLRFHELLKSRDMLVKENKQLWGRAITDRLTGLFNRQYFEEMFEQEFARAKRYRSKLGLLMFDIDHFKGINDDYGHLIGDVVLKELGKLVLNSLRRVDFAARYGGEEFVILLPETTREGVELVAEKIRTQVEEYEFCEDCVLPDGGEMRTVTISMGMAYFPDERFANRIEFLKEADERLYQAKKEGRNRTRASWS